MTRFFTQKNPSTKLPPASTVKLMTAMVALDRLDPAARVKVSGNARAIRSGKPRLLADDDLTVSDLLHLARKAANEPHYRVHTAGTKRACSV